MTFSFSMRATSRREFWQIRPSSIESVLGRLVWELMALFFCNAMQQNHLGFATSTEMVPLESFAAMHRFAQLGSPRNLGSVPATDFALRPTLG